MNNPARVIGFVNAAHFIDHYSMLIFAAAVIVMGPALGMSYSELLPYATPGFVAFGAGSLSSAELFLREAGRAAAGNQDLSTEIAGQFAQVLLHAGQLSEAAQIASRTVAVTDGRDLAAATAMRLVLARAAVITAAWDDARIQLADVRRSGGSAGAC